MSDPQPDASIAPLAPEGAADEQAESRDLDRESAESAREVVERIQPDPACRTQILQLLAESINEAHRLGPDRWAVTMTRGHVRLHVGRYNLLEFGTRYLWLTLDTTLVDAAHRARLAQLRNWQQPRFGVYPTSAAASIFCVELDEVLPLVRAAYLALLRQEAQDYRVGGSAQTNHAPGLLAYLGQDTGQALPERSTRCASRRSTGRRSRPPSRPSTASGGTCRSGRAGRRICRTSTRSSGTIAATP